MTVAPPAAGFEAHPVIRDAGFASVEIGSYRVRSPFIPVNPQIAGTAIA